MLRAITIGMGLVFLFGAGVQYNDPDPLRWATIYLLAAVFSLMSTRNLLPWWLYAASAALTIAWAAVIALGVDAAVYGEMFGDFGMASLEIEEAREAMGLLIIGAWMGVLAGTSRLRQRRVSPLTSSAKGKTS